MTSPLLSEVLNTIGSNPRLRSRGNRLTLAGALYWLDRQRDFMRRCGGDLAGYIRNYGSASDPNHTGDGGEAIYEADVVSLVNLEDLVRELQDKPAEVAHLSKIVLSAQMATTKYTITVNTDRLSTRSIDRELELLAERLNEVFRHPSDPDGYRTITIERG